MCTGAPSQPENCPLQWQFFALIISLSAVSGCISGGAETWVAAPDAETFEVAVYPALLRDCGFPDCHGSEERFFRVHGPGRTRLSDASSIYSPATPEEQTWFLNHAPWTSFNGIPIERAALQNDWLHPNRFGHRRLAEALLPHVADALTRPATPEE